MKKSLLLFVPSLLRFNSCAKKEVTLRFQYCEIKTDKKGNDYFVDSKDYHHYALVFNYEYGHVLDDGDVKNREDRVGRMYPPQSQCNCAHILRGCSLLKKKTSNDLEAGRKLKKNLTFYFHAT